MPAKNLTVRKKLIIFGISNSQVFSTRHFLLLLNFALDMRYQQQGFVDVDVIKERPERSELLVLISPFRIL